MPDTELPEDFDRFPSVITLPVQWGDQDAFGHVNNVVYFRWFESSRIDYMNARGLGDLMEREGIGPILASIGCDYLRQLNFPDTVTIGARVTRIGKSSLDIRHAVFSLADAAVVATGQSTLVTFDYRRQQSVPVPEGIRKAIAAAEEQVF
ncbi:MAG: acyl-CoA thioesterase [Planctomycetota bacterium]|nr:MAG: acyl-CoA thioesterase [Planctomycetota bacterium]